MKTFGGSKDIWLGWKFSRFQCLTFISSLEWCLTNRMHWRTVRLTNRPLTNRPWPTVRWPTVLWPNVRIPVKSRDWLKLYVVTHGIILKHRVRNDIHPPKDNSPFNRKLKYKDIYT